MSSFNNLYVWLNGNGAPEITTCHHALMTGGPSSDAKASSTLCDIMSRSRTYGTLTPKQFKFAKAMVKKINGEKVAYNGPKKWKGGARGHEKKEAISAEQAARAAVYLDAIDPDVLAERAEDFACSQWLYKVESIEGIVLGSPCDEAFWVTTDRGDILCIASKYGDPCTGDRVRIEVNSIANLTATVLGVPNVKVTAVIHNRIEWKI